MPVNDANLRDLHRAVAARLDGIADLLPAAYRLTLVARHTERANADILLTDEDDIDKAVEAARAVYYGQSSIVLPATATVTKALP